MTNQARVDERSVVGIAGVRCTVPLGQLGDIIAPSLDKAMAWLKARAVRPSGAPLIRYHFCPTVPSNDASVDVCIAWPISTPISPDDSIAVESIPGGTYASLVFTGAENGIAGNAALLSWIDENGLTPDCWQQSGGEAFAGRVEYLIDGPEDSPDPSTWRSEVAIKVKLK